MYCSLHESAWTVKAKYAAGIGMLQNDLQNSFEKIYIKKDFFPSIFLKDVWKGYIYEQFCSTTR